MAKPNSFFEKFCGVAQQVIDLAKKPGIERKDRRAIESAYDNAEDAIIDLENSLEKERMKFGELNLQAIVDIQKKIEAHRQVQSILKKEYEHHFDEQLDR